jgi:hypothetical protein
MRVSELMNPNVISITPDESAALAARYEEGMAA